MRYSFVRLLLATMPVSMMGGVSLVLASDPRPNIIFILADDLGYGDLGCYGQSKIKTPRIDRMASEGMRFTQVYAGSTVCAPSRCALMTGFHMGHARIRGNKDVPLLPEDLTVAELLKARGYRTGIVGKWGLGAAESTGIPNRQGFDYWYGYLDQQHAHNYFTDSLWENTQQVFLRENFGGRAAQYAHDLFTAKALEFVRKDPSAPFFLYLAYTIPHADNEKGATTGNGMDVPDDQPYSGEQWPQVEKNFAAMVTRLDTDVGRLLDLLTELSIDRNTVIFFSSDNGPHAEGGHAAAFFESSGPLKGIKRDLNEGGIRVPMIVRWPGVIPAGTESHFVWAFWDFLPTACEIARFPAPIGIDGLSVLPTLKGESSPEHRLLYWEFFERGFDQAVLLGNWKALRRGLTSPIELYDLSRDLGEVTNLAAQHPEIVQQIEAELENVRFESPDWPVPSSDLQPVDESIGLAP